MSRWRYRLAGRLIAWAIRIMPHGRIRTKFQEMVSAWLDELEKELPE